MGDWISRVAVHVTFSRLIGRETGGDARIRAAPDVGWWPHPGGEAVATLVRESCPSSSVVRGVTF